MRSEETAGYTIICVSLTIETTLYASLPMFMFILISFDTLNSLVNIVPTPFIVLEPIVVDITPVQVTGAV